MKNGVAEGVASDSHDTNKYFYYVLVYLYNINYVSCGQSMMENLGIHWEPLVSYQAYDTGGSLWIPKFSIIDCPHGTLLINFQYFKVKILQNYTNQM